MTKTKQTGFTLIEQTITLLIMAILMIWMFSQFWQMTVRHNAKSVVDQMVNAINYARSEAMRRQNVVTLCPSMDGKNCNSSWSNGWIIFFDTAHTGQVTPDELILRIYPAVPAGAQLAWVGSRSDDYLQMSPAGTTWGQDGHFDYSYQQNNQIVHYLIYISQTGRIRVEQ